MALALKKKRWGDWRLQVPTHIRMIDRNATCATNLFSCWIPNTNCALGLLWATSFKFSTSSWKKVGRVSNWAGFIDPGYIGWLEFTWYCRIASTSLRTSCALTKRFISSHSSRPTLCPTSPTWKWDGLHFDHDPSALTRVSWHRWAAAARWATSRPPVPPVVWCTTSLSSKITAGPAWWVRFYCLLSQSGPLHMILCYAQWHHPARPG